MTQGPFVPPFDPLALWRDMLTKWQAAFDATAGNNTATAEFSRFMNQTMGQTMGMSVQLQHALGMVMGKYLAAMNMPTRADLAVMNARLTSIEDQLARLTQQVASASAAPPPRQAAQPTVAEPVAAKPARSKRPPQPAHRAEQAAHSVAAQPARAAKPARRTAKKQGQPS
jgi:hypothetical protein